MPKPLHKYKHIKIIVPTLDKNKELVRNKLYKKVQDKEEKEYGKRPNYQTVNRDIKRLLDEGYIKVIGGTPRKQVLKLTEKGEGLLKDINSKR